MTGIPLDPISTVNPNLIQLARQLGYDLPHKDPEHEALAKEIMSLDPNIFRAIGLLITQMSANQLHEIFEMLRDEISGEDADEFWGNFEEKMSQVEEEDREAIAKLVATLRTKLQEIFSQMEPVVTEEEGEKLTKGLVGFILEAVAKSVDSEPNYSFKLGGVIHEILVALTPHESGEGHHLNVEMDAEKFEQLSDEHKQTYATHMADVIATVLETPEVARQPKIKPRQNAREQMPAIIERHERTHGPIHLEDRVVNHLLLLLRHEVRHEMAIAHLMNRCKVSAQSQGEWSNSLAFKQYLERSHQNNVVLIPVPGQMGHQTPRW